MRYPSKRRAPYGKFAACGGTFDRLHDGHKALLLKAFSSAERVLVGVTSQDFAEKKTLGEIIQPLKERRTAVAAFLSSKRLLWRASLTEISDEYGPLLSARCPCDCIVVSPETLPGARRVNSARRRKRLPRLPIAVCRLVLAADRRRISSMRVRIGDCNRAGAVFFKSAKPFTLGPRLRTILRKPFGSFFPTAASASAFIRRTKPTKLVLVGDLTSRVLARLKPDVCVIDGKIMRKKVPRMRFGEKTVSVRNPAGRITPVLYSALRSALRDGRVLVSVLGEEDLAVLPAVLFAPLGSAVVYGQPPSRGSRPPGLVVVTVDEAKKQQTLRILRAR
ncbi:hypothetical protein COT29_00850 [Candidatus Micrarchaeota archaeon CG08_land_8_20_14_0_20_59_11]|nr:MAG: hypothetical protein COT29_00850 [Candidatus Micrarchaeota archaeon CG08_land_8_20_14_0_20_59_11]PIT85907.1 MAG: hypothetical protein COU36_00650 [Candidatus Micrarchaeota archaeon CG10_big_fil_rev_8_21_14_0_10_59_7]